MASPHGGTGRGSHPGAVACVQLRCSQKKTSLQPTFRQVCEESQTWGPFMWTRGLWHLVAVSHSWAQNTLTTRGPLKLARNIKEGDKKKTTSPLYGHTLLYTAPDMSHHQCAVSRQRCMLGIIPSMKCARFTCRRCLGPKGNQEVRVHQNYHQPDQPWRDICHRKALRRALFPYCW